MKRSGPLRRLANLQRGLPKSYRAQRACRKCGAVFTLDHPRRAYCSDTCRAAMERPTRTVPCTACGVPVTRRIDYLTRPNAPVGVHCRTCAIRVVAAKSAARTYPDRRNGVMVACAWCKADVYRTPSDAALGRKVFCHRRCQTAWNRAQPSMPLPSVDNSGSRNGRFRTGRRVGEHITKPLVREAVARRDGAWCLLCGQPPPGLHLHRVRYGSEGGQYELDNCVQLCRMHHLETVHANKRLWKPLLLAYIEAGGGEAARAPLVAALDALAARYG